MLATLIACHLVGDFLLQNDWMQAKSRNSFVCTVHVLCYSLPFFVLMLFVALPPWLLLAILVEHWLQDRFGLHIKWMKLYGQTPPDKWPVGPLCMDQSMHTGFIAILTLLPL